MSLAQRMHRLARQGALARFAVDPLLLPLQHQKGQDAVARARATFLQSLVGGLSSVAPAAHDIPETRGDYESLLGGDADEGERLLATLHKALAARGWGQDTLGGLERGAQDLPRIRHADSPLTEAFLPGSWAGTEADAALKHDLHAEESPGGTNALRWAWTSRYGGHAHSTARNVADYLGHAGHGEAAQLFMHLLTQGLSTGSLEHLLAAHRLLLGHADSLPTRTDVRPRTPVPGSRPMPHYDALEVVRHLAPLLAHNHASREAGARLLEGQQPSEDRETYTLHRFDEHGNFAGTMPEDQYLLRRRGTPCR